MQGCFQSVTIPKYPFCVPIPHHFFRSIPLVIRILSLIGLFSRSLVTTRFVRNLFPAASSPAGNRCYSFKPGCGSFDLFLRACAPTMIRTFSGKTRRWQEMSWDSVYRLVQQIPRGRVLTYGALARALRLPGGGRTAGRAMAACPSGKGIPWHRVVGAGGKLLIREPYASLQRKLLESEGVALTESRLNLKLHLWNRPGKSAKRAKKTRPKKKNRSR